MFESLALLAGFHTMAMIGEPTKQGGRHLYITKHLLSLGQSHIGGDQHVGAFVEF